MDDFIRPLHQTPNLQKKMSTSIYEKKKKTTYGWSLQTPDATSFSFCRQLPGPDLTTTPPSKWQLSHQGFL